MLLIYPIVNYLYRKYGVPLHNFFENWTRGISHLKVSLIFFVKKYSLHQKPSSCFYFYSHESLR